MNQKKFRPRIALIVDQPQRDLAGLVLVASELARRGAVCYLVPANLRLKEIWALAPDLVILYCFRRGYERFVRQMLRAGIQFGLLDAEGGVWPDFDSYAELLWDDKELMKKASCICMWGPKMTEQALERGLFRPEQVSITGCPRFDMYDPTWHAVLRDDDIHRGGHVNGRARILVNTNLTEANPRFASAETIRKQFLEVFGWSASRYEDWLAVQQRALEETIGMVQRLAADYSNATIVLRPHPFERTDIYKARLSGLPNVEINESGPVQPQLYRAAVVIQRSCTTGIEAGLASVPTFSPLWVPTPAIMPMAEAASVPCTSYHDLRSNLDLVLAHSYKVPDDVDRNIRSVIEDWFFKNDGLSYKRASDAILSCVGPERRVNQDLCRKFLYGLDGTRKRMLPHLSSNVRYWLGIPSEWSFQHMRVVPFVEWAQTDQYFSADDVQHLANRMIQTGAFADNGAHRLQIGPARGAEFHKHKYQSQSVVVECFLD